MDSEYYEMHRDDNLIHDDDSHQPSILTNKHEKSHHHHNMMVYGDGNSDFEHHHHDSDHHHHNDLSHHSDHHHHHPPLVTNIEEEMDNFHEMNVPPSAHHAKNYAIQNIMSLLILSVIVITLGVAIISSIFIYPVLRTKFSVISDHKMEQLEKTVIVLHIGAFRHDYLTKYASSIPTILSIRDRGLSVDGIRSVFPATSLPNEYTVMTGYYPENHGMLADNMFDRVKNVSFSETWNETDWWSGAEPLWVSMKKWGNYSSFVYDWSGCNVPGMSATHSQGSRDVEHASSVQPKVDDLIEHFEKDLVSKSDHTLLYAVALETLTEQMYNFGPFSDEIASILEVIDRSIANLLNDIAMMRIDPYNDLNIVITSTYGSMSLDHQCSVHISELLGPHERSLFIMPNMGPYVDLIAHNGVSAGEINAVYNSLKQKESLGFYSAYMGDQLPAKFQYNHTWLRHPNRAPNIILVSKPHCSVVTAFYESNNGDNAFDPDIDDMKGFLVAIGPKFVKRDHPLKGFDSVHMYSLLTHVMELNNTNSKAMDASFEHVRHLFADSEH